MTNPSIPQASELPPTWNKRRKALEPKLSEKKFVIARRALANDLRSHAASLRRRAAEREKFADKLDAERAIGWPLFKEYAMKAFELGNRRIAEMMRLDSNCTRGDMLRAVYPEIDWDRARLGQSATTVASRGDASPGRLVPRDVPPARVFEIDGEKIYWSREPLTLREAKIRKNYLEQKLAGPLPMLRLQFSIDYCHGGAYREPASDLAAAIAVEDRDREESREGRAAEELAAAAVGTERDRFSVIEGGRGDSPSVLSP